jgi:uncharacterized protein YydD (DUF2326 family)
MDCSIGPPLRTERATFATLSASSLFTKYSIGGNIFISFLHSLLISVILSVPGKIFTKWTYRKSISYFLRTQHDFGDVFQLAKYNKGKHRDWKPFLFDLLGFDGKSLQ